MHYAANLHTAHMNKLIFYLAEKLLRFHPTKKGGVAQTLGNGRKISALVSTQKRVCCLAQTLAIKIVAQ